MRRKEQATLVVCASDIVHFGMHKHIKTWRIYGLIKLSRVVTSVTELIKNAVSLYAGLDCRHPESHFVARFQWIIRFRRNFAHLIFGPSRGLTADSPLFATAMDSLKMQPPHWRLNSMPRHGEYTPWIFSMPRRSISLSPYLTPFLAAGDADSGRTGNL